MLVCEVGGIEVVLLGGLWEQLWCVEVDIIVCMFCECGGDCWMVVQRLEIGFLSLYCKFEEFEVLGVMKSEI